MPQHVTNNSEPSNMPWYRAHWEIIASIATILALSAIAIGLGGYYKQDLDFGVYNFGKLHSVTYLSFLAGGSGLGFLTLIYLVGLYLTRGSQASQPQHSPNPELATPPEHFICVEENLPDPTAPIVPQFLAERHLGKLVNSTVSNHKKAPAPQSTPSNSKVGEPSPRQCPQPPSSNQPPSSAVPPPQCTPIIAKKGGQTPQPQNPLNPELAPPVDDPFRCDEEELPMLTVGILQFPAGPRQTARLVVPAPIMEEGIPEETSYIQCSGYVNTGYLDNKNRLLIDHDCEVIYFPKGEDPNLKLQAQKKEKQELLAKLEEVYALGCLDDTEYDKILKDIENLHEQILRLDREIRYQDRPIWQNTNNGAEFAIVANDSTPPHKGPYYFYSTATGYDLVSQTLMKLKNHSDKIHICTKAEKAAYLKAHKLPPDDTRYLIRTKTKHLICTNNWKNVPNRAELLRVRPNAGEIAPMS